MCLAQGHSAIPQQPRPKPRTFQSKVVGTSHCTRMPWMESVQWGHWGRSLPGSWLSSVVLLCPTQTQWDGTAIGPPSERISDVYILPTPRHQRAAQAMTIAPRWQTLWRQHSPFGGTLARTFGPRIWRGRQTPFTWTCEPRDSDTKLNGKKQTSTSLSCNGIWRQTWQVSALWATLLCLHSQLELSLAAISVHQLKPAILVFGQWSTLPSVHQSTGHFDNTTEGDVSKISHGATKFLQYDLLVLLYDVQLSVIRWY